MAWPFSLYSLSRSGLHLPATARRGVPQAAIQECFFAFLTDRVPGPGTAAARKLKIYLDLPPLPRYTRANRSHSDLGKLGENLKNLLQRDVQNWLRRLALAAKLGLIAASAHAGTLVVVPNAISYETFGLNFAENIQSSTAVGTLDYTGFPGCGGSCIATTQLGTDPFVSLTVNEVVFEFTGGGGAESELGYYVEYVNPTPGTYTVTLHTAESLSLPDGISHASAYLAIGQSANAPGSFTDFASYAFREADCLNGCPPPGFAGITPAPFNPAPSIQMVANVPYFMVIDLLMRPEPSNLPVTASIDPTFSTTAAGGYFAFSAGVISDAPEPGAWLLILTGFALGGLALRRKTMSAA